MRLREVCPLKFVRQWRRRSSGAPGARKIPGETFQSEPEDRCSCWMPSGALLPMSSVSDQRRDAEGLSAGAHHAG
jgi:hypothetical protein